MKLKILYASKVVAEIARTRQQGLSQIQGVVSNFSDRQTSGQFTHYDRRAREGRTACPLSILPAL